MFFFFSSRRRHTRLQGDWSSDVCSSDLPTVRELERRVAALESAEDGVAFSSGMAAMTTAILASVKAGEHVVLFRDRSEEHTSELQSPCNLVCRLLLEKKKNHETMTRVRQ